MTHNSHIHLNRSKKRHAESRQLLELGMIGPAAAAARMTLDSFSVETFGHMPERPRLAEILLRVTGSPNWRNTLWRFRRLHKSINLTVHGCSDPTERTVRQYLRLAEIVGCRWLALLESEGDDRNQQSDRPESEVTA